MTKQNTTDRENLISSYQSLIKSQKTLLLSTTFEETPNISYAPYVRDQQGRFYIFVSQLAAHTRNLNANGKASVMLIQSEQASDNLHARLRATFSCKALQINRQDPLFAAQMQAMMERFGDIIGLLQTLPDFHLYCLTPNKGQFIAGFGQAYAIDLEKDAPVLVESK